ncbi:MAG: extracellular solute-binding protein, partial [Syntrophales bacterium LBB04]|nr:extracellular solute-binding protein [Syntrophales bacterium LBB04]
MYSSINSFTYAVKGPNSCHHTSIVMFSVGKAKPGFVCLGAVAASTVELQIQVALTLWRDVTKVCGDPKNTKSTASNPNQDFLDGFTAMWITGPWATPQVLASPIKNDFTVVGFPQVDPKKPHTMVYGWAWGVNKNKPENSKIVSWDFVRFMLAKPDQWLAKAGFVQPVKGVSETPVAKKFPFFNVHMKDVQTATWYIRSENVNEIAQAVG